MILVRSFILYHFIRHLSSKEWYFLKIKDLTGKRFGRLTVVSFAGRNKYNRSLWNCLCDCGNQKIVNSNSLKRGLTKSCGCLDKEKHITHPNRTTHGECGTRLYRIWQGMISRCYNPNTPSYQKWYGSKGVTVCDEWRYNFWIFRNRAVLHGYKDNLTIDRIDPYGNYEPSNCRWATFQEQTHNKRGSDSH